MILRRQCSCDKVQACGGTCAAQPVRRLEAGSSDGTDELALVRDAIGFPGRSLDAATRDVMEPRFGHDFSRVRVHTDEHAAQSARRLGARAYTTGRDIVFAAGEYAPGSRAGQQLLAHELTHVVQQRGATGAPDRIGGKDDAAEREADAAAAAVMRADEARTPSSNATAVRRSPSSPSSSSSSSSSGGGSQGGAFPTPTREPDGGCGCRLDVCWRPIQLWYVPSYYKHGFINLIDRACQHHNIYVDPGRHGGHSHAEDKPGAWDTSGENCFSLSPAFCPLVDDMIAAVPRYEGMDVAYDATGGPNSNSFIEWVLNEGGLTNIPSPHSGLKAWDYYQTHAGQRSSPPRFQRAAPADAGTIPAPPPR